MTLTDYERGYDKGYERGFDAAKAFYSIMNAPNKDFGEWIPWGDKLPRVGEYVLISINRDAFPDAKHDVMIAKFSPDEKDWKTHRPDAVRAWMPLPEPYKKEGEAE